MRRQTVVGLASVVVMSLTFAPQAQARIHGAPSVASTHVQPLASRATQAARITTERKVRLAVSAAADPTNQAWVDYYNSPADISTWLAFCQAGGGSSYIIVGTVPAVPACSPAAPTDSAPQISIPGCDPGPCSGDASLWRVADYYPGFQCAELAERYLYLRYGWAGRVADGDQVVHTYAQTLGLPEVMNGGTAPAIGDVMSFSASPNFTDAGGGHVGIVTAVTLGRKAGTVTVVGQNQTSPDAASDVLTMQKSSRGWMVSTANTGLSAYPYIEWLHAQPIITFSEFTVGTAITNQYIDDGIVFGGDSPFIATDGANPTSPVLSGTPLYQGSITGTFVVPGTNAPAGVREFSVDVGYINNPNSVEVVYFDAKGRRIGSLLASVVGIDTLNVSSSHPIGSFLVHSVAPELAGWAIDNVAIRR